MNTVEQLKLKYTGAVAWQFGDTIELANELADLVARGIKTAGCGSLASFNSVNRHVFGRHLRVI